MSIYGGSKTFDELTPGLDSTTLALTDLVPVRDISVGNTSTVATQKLTIADLFAFAVANNLIIPDQIGKNGKFIKSDGSVISWQSIAKSLMMIS